MKPDKSRAALNADPARIDGSYSQSASDEANKQVAMQSRAERNIPVKSTSRAFKIFPHPNGHKELYDKMTTPTIDTLREIFDEMFIEAKGTPWTLQGKADYSLFRQQELANAVKEARTKILAWVDGLIPDKSHPYSLGDRLGLVEPIIAESVNTPQMVEPWINKGRNQAIDEIRTRAGLSGGDDG